MKNRQFCRYVFVCGANLISMMTRWLRCWVSNSIWNTRSDAMGPGKGREILTHLHAFIWDNRRYVCIIRANEKVSKQRKQWQEMLKLILVILSWMIIEIEKHVVWGADITTNLFSFYFLCVCVFCSFLYFCLWAVREYINKQNFS